MDQALKLKYFTLIRNLEGKDYLTSIIAYSVAPTIQGQKPSTLIGFTSRRKNILNLWEKYKDEVCKKLGVTYFEIKVSCGKNLVLFYKEELLLQHIEDRNCQAFLKKVGYEAGISLNEKLNILKSRFQRMCPHEVGVFLGIPIEDIEGFVENNGEGYLFYKYWKVYHNPEKAKKIFDLYDASKASMIQMIEESYLNQ